MNGNESGQKISARELTEEIERATNTSELGAGQLEAGGGSVGLGRERAGAIGSAILAGQYGENANGGQTTEQELNVERVKQIVEAENRLGEEQRMAMATPTLPEALIMPQVQAKVDKAMTRALSQLTEREGNRPGMLDEKVNDLRRQYRVSWETGR